MEHYNSLLAVGKWTTQKRQYRRHCQGKVLTKIKFAISRRHKINRNDAQCVQSLERITVVIKYTSGQRHRLISSWLITFHCSELVASHGQCSWSSIMYHVLRQSQIVGPIIAGNSTIVLSAIQPVSICKVFFMNNQSSRLKQLEVPCTWRLRWRVSTSGYLTKNV